MSRLADIREQDATGKAADIFAGIKKSDGQSAERLSHHRRPLAGGAQQALAHNAMLHKGSLSAQQLEAINLSVSEATGCDYCLAAHTLMAKKPASAANKSTPCAAGSMRKRRSLMRW